MLGNIASGRVTLSAGTPYTVMVYPSTLDTSATPYELQIKVINRAPETAHAALVPGDTVLESLDYVGDVDDFTVSGVPGSRHNLFLDASGTAPHGAQASIVVDNSIVFEVTAVAGTESLASNATGVFTVPASGQLKVTVMDWNERNDLHRGPYRLLVTAIDPRPEGVAADLTLDRVTTSQIDGLGDIDEFHLSVPRDTTVNFVFHGVNASPRRLGFSLLNARDSVIGVRTLSDGYLAPSGDSAGFGAWLLKPGSYTIRVAPRRSASGGYVGEYSILPRTINTAPETHSATITVGDTVSDEGLDVAGDIDAFSCT